MHATIAERVITKQLVRYTEEALDEMGARLLRLIGLSPLMAEFRNKPGVTTRFCRYDYPTGHTFDRTHELALRLEARGLVAVMAFGTATFDVMITEAGATSLIVLA